MVTIRVTQEHIDKGARRRCTACPVALAVREAGYPAAEFGNTIWTPTEGNGEYLGLPLEVSKFISPAIQQQIS